MRNKPAVPTFNRRQFLERAAGSALAVGLSSPHHLRPVAGGPLSIRDENLVERARQSTEYPDPRSGAGLREAKLTILKDSHQPRFVS